MSAQGRLMVTDEAWQVIVTVLDRSKHQAGSPLQPSDRMCIEAMISVTRSGMLGRDLPKLFGT